MSSRSKLSLVHLSRVYLISKYSAQLSSQGTCSSPPNIVWNHDLWNHRAFKLRVPQYLKSCECHPFFAITEYGFLTSHSPIWVVATWGLTLKCLKWGIFPRWSRKMIQCLKTHVSTGLLPCHLFLSDLEQSLVNLVSDLSRAGDKPSLSQLREA